MQGGSLYHFYDGLWYDLAGTQTHDLLCERRTRLTTKPTRHGAHPFDSTIKNVSTYVSKSIDFHMSLKRDQIKVHASTMRITSFKYPTF